MTRDKYLDGKLIEMDGVPVREVPPDFWVRHLSPVDESEKPVLAWWARHPNGKFTPVYKGQDTPSGRH